MRRNFRVRRCPTGIEPMAGTIEVDDQRCMIRSNGFPFRASRFISAQTTLFTMHEKREAGC